MNVFRKISESLDSAEEYDKLDRLVAYCKKNKYLFCDKQFPPKPESLFGDPPHPEYNNQFEKVDWARPKNIFGSQPYHLFNNINPSDILQGSLGHCYFMCSLSAIAEQPELVKRLFKYDTLNEFGVVGVWLNINGGWRMYVLDEYLPVNKDSNPKTLSFSRSVENELWVMYLEKAYAKAYGSYFDIIGGDPVHALRDLTGAPYEYACDFDDLSAVWKKLLNYNDTNFIFVGWTKSTTVVEEKSASGLVSGHAYSILNVQEVKDSTGKLARIMQIRNPWGRFEWTGDFNDKSPLWTPELKKKLGVQERDDGLFWMRIEDFIKDFGGIGILKIMPDYFFDSVMVEQSLEDKSGKSVFRLNVPSDTVGTISLDQVDSRIVDEKEYTYSYFRVTLARIESNKVIETVCTVASPDRNIFIETELKKGTYVILVEGYWMTDFVRSFCVSTYTRDKVQLYSLNLNASAFDTLEYLAWKTFLIRNKSQLTPDGQRTINGDGPVHLEQYKYKSPTGYFVLYCTFNNSKSQPAQLTYKLNY